MSMLGQTRVAGRIDDDMLRRLMHAIEEAAGDAPRNELPAAIERMIDGDLYLAYQRVNSLFAEQYPDLYGDGADD